MQLVAENRLLFGAYTSEGCALGKPFPTSAGAGYQTEADDLHRQAVKHALAVTGEVQAGKSNAPDQVESFGQVAPSTIERL